LGHRLDLDVQRSPVAGSDEHLHLVGNPDAATVERLVAVHAVEDIVTAEVMPGITGIQGISPVVVDSCELLGVGEVRVPTLHIPRTSLPGLEGERVDLVPIPQSEITLLIGLDQSVLDLAGLRRWLVIVGPHGFGDRGGDHSGIIVPAASQPSSGQKSDEYRKDNILSIHDPSLFFGGFVPLGESHDELINCLKLLSSGVKVLCNRLTSEA